MLLLVDADSIYWPICYKTKKKHEIRKAIDRTMRGMKCKAEVEGDDFFSEVEMVVAVKGHDNFRKRIYEPYKGHRNQLDDEMKEALKYGHEHMVEKWNGIESTGAEADDFVSIWAAEARANGIDHIVAHIDKDLNMIPGKHYHYQKDYFYEVSEDEADLNFMKQCLTGDSTDNIKGLHRVGPAKAAKILDGVSYEDRWKAVTDAWKSHKMPYEDQCMSARLLWMSTTWEEVETANESIIAKLEGRDAIRRVQDNGAGSDEHSDECEAVLSKSDELSEQEVREA